MVVAASARRSLDRLPQRVRLRIQRAVDSLTVNPRGPGSIKLRGRIDLWRVRMGDYRVIYAVDDGAHRVVVLRIDHRRDVYR